MQEKSDNFAKILISMNFHKDEERSDSYVLNQNKSFEKEKPWAIDTWRISFIQGAWKTEQVDLCINLGSLEKRLDQAFKTIYGKKTKLELIPALNYGVWVLVELSPSEIKNDEFPNGTVGFHFNLACENASVCLHFSKHFIIGYSPPSFIAEASLLFFKCLDFSNRNVTKEYGLFEGRVDFADLMISNVERNNQFSKIKDQAIDFGDAIKKGIHAHLKSNFNGEIWRITATSFDNNLFEFDLPPIEIVESRELGKKYSKIDSLILSKKIPEAKKICMSALEKDPDSLFLFRRRCLIAFAEEDAIDDVLLQKMISLDNENLLFLSLACFTYMKKNKSKLLLKYLSKLGQLLNDELQNFDELETLDMVLPELLGDGWSPIDVQTAQTCYQRVVQKRGDLPRVLRKMIGIAKENQDVEGEISLLNRLVKVESNKVLLAANYMRMASLYQPTNKKLASDNAINAWKIIPTNTNYAEFASQCLIESKEFEKAVRVLDDCRKQIDAIEDNQKKIDLEMAIARIWFDSLKRKDLAKLRVEHALLLMPDDIANLKRCEDICLEFDEQSLIVDIRQRIFHRAIRLNDKEDVFRVAHELIKFYKDQDNMDGQIAKIYEKLVENYLVEPSELYYLLELKNVNINWMNLLDNIRKHLKNRDVNSRVEFYTFIGDIAHQKINDHALAAEYYERAIDLGRTDVKIYDFLNNYYGSINKPELRDKILKHKLRNAQKEQRIPILKELYHTAQTLSDKDLDKYSVLILTEASDSDPVKKRFKKYQRKDDVKSIENLLDQLINDISDKNETFKWILFTKDIVEDCKNPARFELIEKLIQSLKPFYKDIFEWYELGVNAHKKDEDYKFIEPYLNKLILNGIFPNLEEKITLKILKSNPIARGLYYRQLADRSTGKNNEKAILSLREALPFLMGKAGYEQATENTLEQLSRLVVLRKDELETYRQLVDLADKSESFYDVLENQLNRASNEEQYKQLKDIAMDIIVNNPTEVLKFAKSLLKCVETFESHKIVEFRFQLLEINNQYRHFLPEVWGKMYLRDLNNWQDDQRYTAILDWILEEPKNRETVASIFKENMIKLRTKRDFNQLDTYSLLARTYDFSFNTYNWLLFQYFQTESEFEKSAYYWVECIRNMKELSLWHKFWQESLDYLGSDNDDIYQLLKIAYNELIQTESAQVYEQVCFEYGMFLFINDKEPKLSYKLLKEHYLRNPEDTETWLPIYFLNSILQKLEEQYDLLYFIIPRIVQNPDIIGSYPITTESMYKDFVNAAKKLKRSDKIKDFEFRGSLKPALSHKKNKDESKTLKSEKAPSLEQEKAKPVNLDSLFAKSVIDSTRSEQKKQRPIPKSVTSLVNDGIHKQGGDNSLPPPPPVESSSVQENARLEELNKDTVAIAKQEQTQVSVMNKEKKERKSFLNLKKPRWPFASKAEGPPPISSQGLPPDPKTNQGSSSENWKNFLKGDHKEKLLPKIQGLTFSNREEKYLALQVAVLNDGGSFELMDQFNWLDFVQPWDGQWKDMKLDVLESDLFKVLNISKDFLSEYYQEKFNLRTISRVFDLSIDKFLASRSTAKFTDLFSWPWAESYEKLLKDMNIDIVMIDGPEKVLFEARKSKLYVGQSLALSPNPSLLHHILFVIRSIQIGLFEVLMFKERLREPLHEYLKSLSSDADKKLLSNALACTGADEAYVDFLYRSRQQVLNILFAETRNLIDLVHFELKLDGKSSDGFSADLIDKYLPLMIKPV